MEDQAPAERFPGFLVIDVRNTAADIGGRPRNTEY